jgi:SAM-dependent methyltransferase
MTQTDGHFVDGRKTRTETQTQPPTQTQTPTKTEAGRRFDALAALFDPATFRHIEKLGIGPGGRCWEVGAYGNSVVTWLVKKVGPTGRVLVTDTDISRVASAARPPVEVRRHDVGAEPPPDESFDLVHARHVLVHVPDHARALQSMVKALRPGGHLLVEDTDPALQPLLCPDEHGPAQELANRLRQAFGALLAERGADLSYGRRLPRLMREAGLRQVEADVHFPLASPACAELETATVQEVRAHLVSAGRATDEEIDRHLMNVAAGEMDLATAPMISAWGRKARKA